MKSYHSTMVEKAAMASEPRDMGFNGGSSAGYPIATILRGSLCHCSATLVNRLAIRALVAAPPDVDHVEIGRSLALHASERGIANRAGQMGLAFLQRLRIVGRSHGQFAEERIVEMLNVHCGILDTVAGSESG